MALSLESQSITFPQEYDIFCSFGDVGSTSAILRIPPMTKRPVKEQALLSDRGNLYTDRVCTDLEFTAMWVDKFTMHASDHYRKSFS